MMPHLARATSRSRRRPRSRGQTLVEFALVVPVLFLVLCGTMDFGFLLYSRMTVINAAREGARVATTMTEDPGAIQGVVATQVSAVAGGLAVTTATCRVPKGSPDCPDPSGGFDGAKAGDSVRVTVGYNHSVFFPLLFGATIPMSSKVQMVLE